VIKIEGLTKKQAAIAQLLWDCDSEESLLMLIKYLPTDEDRKIATSLRHLIIWEFWEQERGLDEFSSAAQMIIESAQG
jgi:hypothetical protein